MTEAVNFKAKVDAKHLYEFQMYHSYHSIQGILSIVVAVLCLIAGISSIGRVSATYTALYFLFMFLFIVYMPLSLLLRAKQQSILSDIFKEGLDYTIDEKGIITRFKKEKGELSWNQVTKVCQSRHNLMIYSSRVNVYVIPKEEMGEKSEQVMQLVKKYVSEEKLK